MELDRTRIEIRQRNWADLADLTLIVLREYWRPVLLWGLLGAFPFMLINQFVLYPLLDFETILLGNELNATVGLLQFRYIYHSIGLVVLEAPFAMQGVTYFLGQAVFVDRPPWQDVLRSIRGSFGRCLLVLGLLRGGLLGIPVLFFVPREVAFEPFLELFLMTFAVLGTSIAIRMFRPFAPEILMLERCPLRLKGTEDRVTYKKRSYWLHQPLSTDLAGRWIVLAGLIGMGFFSLALGERFVIGVFFGYWKYGWWFDWILLPLNCWIFAIIATLFRFLSYLDSRIRLEGWEVELRFRAEAARLEANLS